MSFVRPLLERLSFDSLVHLQRTRALGPRSGTEERITALSRSYRGDVAALLGDLRKEELLTILDWRFIVRGRRFLPPGLQNCSRDELIRFALRLFVRREIPREFVAEDVSRDMVLDDPTAEAGEPAAAVATVTDEDTGDEPEDDEAGPADAGEPTEDDDGPEPVFLDDPVPEATSTESLTGEWSRPRKLSSVMRMVGLEPVQRLRTAKFQEVMRLLGERKIELQLADDRTLLTETDESPGMQLKVRLRLRQATSSPIAPAPTAESPRSAPESVARPTWLGAVAFPLINRGAYLSLVRARPNQGPERGAPFVTADAQVGEMLEWAHLAVASYVDAHGSPSTPPESLDVDVTDTEGALLSGSFRLAAALAMVSARLRRPLVPQLAVVGDLDMDGQVLPVDRLAERLAAVRSSGYTQVLIPVTSLDSLSPDEPLDDLALLPVGTLAEAVTFALEASTLEAVG